MANGINLIDMDNDRKDLDFSCLYDEKYKDKIIRSLWSSLWSFVWFAGLLVYEETVFHIWAFGGLKLYYFLKILLCLPLAALLSTLTSYFPRLANKILNWILSVVVMIYFVVHIVYHAIFKVFFSTAFIDKTNTKVVQYYRETIQGILDNWVVILFAFIVPIVALVLLDVFRVLKHKQGSAKCIYIQPAAILIFTLLICLIVPAYGKEEYSPYDMMKYANVTEYSIEELGVFATTQIEIRNMIIPRKASLDDDFTVWEYKPDTATSVSTTTDTSVNAPDASEETETSTDNPIEEVVEKVIDRSPNILNIDFVTLSENEPDETVAAIHRYMASLEPSYKNEYTGMFEGFNLIFMTAEGFSSFAVDEKLTPTLYKIIHEGFYFPNFYNPRTGGSTSDGEFVCSTSLEPTNGGAKNFRIVGQNEMPFSLGNYFNRDYGITSRAFHDNDFQYYGRDITYPGMGYFYKAVGNGLVIPRHWPSSDLDMMKASVPDYIDDEIFNIYYMTVSGHLNYNFTGNYCAKIHQDDVADLPYSEPCRAYIACNMELDLALKYLIEQLEEKGIADKTVICFTGDHWPYGLENAEISEILGHDVEETFELYKSNLILWSGAIKEPIVIDKPACSMDILPTLLNLFGFDYDSRLLMGRDILDPQTEGFAAMFDKSFITEKVMYKRNGEVTNLTSEEVSDEYLSERKKYLSNKWKYSQYIMDTDYYSYIADVLGIEVIPAEQNYVPDYARFTR